MSDNKMDLGEISFKLKNIVSTLGLILEGVEEEHHYANEISEHEVGRLAFVNRMGGSFIPALDLVYCSAYELLEQVEAAE